MRRPASFWGSAGDVDLILNPQRHLYDIASNSFYASWWPICVITLFGELAVLMWELFFWKLHAYRVPYFGFRRVSWLRNLRNLGRVQLKCTFRSWTAGWTGNAVDYCLYQHLQFFLVFGVDVLSMSVSRAGVSGREGGDCCNYCFLVPGRSRDYVSHGTSWYLVIKGDDSGIHTKLAGVQVAIRVTRLRHDGKTGLWALFV